ncbi:hypothetical protein [Natrononativus amylolyticus]|uniref:hypothetical protein n=1 Tax=Natrononativus amylolyticus TaxID=2963434 RepID=UPI0020CFC6EA|nr:hypothetical protein [Natrononativus amylolyticus]
MDSSDPRHHPVDERWYTLAVDGVIGVQIADADGGEPSESAWIWSSRWYDAAAAR